MATDDDFADWCNALASRDTVLSLDAWLAQTAGNEAASILLVLLADAGDTGVMPTGSAVTRY